MPKRIAIIGAGPIGLEAGLAATKRGYEVSIYDEGTVGNSVRRWGHVRMFSPFSMNASADGIDLLRRQGRPLPAGDAYLTGDEFASAYLDPLAQMLPVQTHCKVKAIVREHSGKRDKIGEPDREDTPFRLLVEQAGSERHEYADIIFDCSGTFQTPNPLGDGGIPALGEAAARARICYGLSEAGKLEACAGLRVLVVGGGHSAANIIVSLAELKDVHPQTEIHWVVRRQGFSPCAQVSNDPLAERERICRTANEAAASGKAILHDGATVTEFAPRENALQVTLQTPGGSKIITVDRAISATGFRPDWSFARELHIQTCWATEGTYPLAASLLGESGGDCLAVPAFGADTLLHPEPNFYALGMKSYGRTPDFLITTGLKQIEQIMEKLQ